MNKYSQLCVWESCCLGGRPSEDFEQFIYDECGARVKFSEEVKTLPDINNGYPVEGTGNRTDLFFYLHEDDIPQFAIKRFQFGIRWYEDVIADNKDIYSLTIRNKYNRG
jgi:hypothetical protein